MRDLVFSCLALKLNCVKIRSTSESLQMYDIGRAGHGAGRVQVGHKEGTG